ncbi:MAG TPA: AAA family ATPase [Candidatus Limnocylindrales bacterium]|nr:AAA family ATPase [Candidatus Limnocylindrales bacterium]
MNRHLERIEWRPRREIDRGGWPFTIPAVEQLIDEGGFDVPAGVTILVGENGSGKSTLVEAFAAVYPRHGAESSSRISVTGPERSEEDSPLHWHLKARTAFMAAPGGFFLRAEAMHTYFSRIDADLAEQRAWGGQSMQARSHGESFLEVLRQRFSDRGVYFLDEPESALSFQSSLALLVILDALRQEGSQVILATHSPLLAALPGANLIEIGGWGMRPSTWDELELTRSWKGFLDAPERWFKHLLG